MLSSEVAQSLKSYRHFSDLGVGIVFSHRHVGCLGKASTSIHGRGEDDTANTDHTVSGEYVQLSFLFRVLTLCLC